MARDKNFCEVETLNKLTEVFWQKGYNGTSMDDLLQQSNLSRSSLYATYGDKRSLFLMTLKEYAHKQQDYLNEGLKRWKSAAEGVDELFSSLINKPKSDCGYAKGCYIVNAIVEWSTADDAISEIVQQNKTAITKAFARMIKRDIDNGIISADKSPNALASFVFSTYTGLLVSIKAGASKKELTEIKNVVLETVEK